MEWHFIYIHSIFFPSFAVNLNNVTSSIKSAAIAGNHNNRLTYSKSMRALFFPHIFSLVNCTTTTVADAVLPLLFRSVLFCFAQFGSVCLHLAEMEMVAMYKLTTHKTLAVCVLMHERQGWQQPIGQFYNVIAYNRTLLIDVTTFHRSGDRTLVSLKMLKCMMIA